MRDDAYENKLTQLSGGWNASFAALLILIAAITVLPMLLVIVISFTSKESITDFGYSFFPKGWSLAGYTELFRTGTQLMNSYIVSIEYTLAGTASSLFVMSMSAYVISQRQFKYHTFLKWMMFITMLFGGGLVPSYIMNTQYLHLGDTFWIYVLPGLINAWSIIVLWTFQRTVVPDSLIEAARIDGAKHVRIWLSIVTPLMKAGLATIALQGFVGRWNDWFTSVLYITKPTLVPLQTLLYKLQVSISFIKENARIAASPEGLQILKNLPSESLRMACTVMVVLPILFAYPFFQRYFIRGMVVGSLKE